MRNTVPSYSSITKLLLPLLTLTLMGCQSLLYFPQKGLLVDPAKVQLSPEEVFIPSQDGNILHAWYFGSATAENKGTLLFFHGNGENLTSHYLMFRWLPAQGYSYLIFDYPGYGRSTGKPSPQGTVEAGIAAARWLHENKKPSRLILYGHSLGGNVALRTGEEIREQIPFSNVIIEASFASYRGIGRKVLSRHWLTWLLQPLTYVVLSDKYAPRDISSFAPTPMLFITGDADPIIEPENSEDLYNLALDPKELWLVPGGSHGNLYEIRQGELRQRLLRYLKKTSTH